MQGSKSIIAIGRGAVNGFEMIIILLGILFYVEHSTLYMVNQYVRAYVLVAQKEANPWVAVTSIARTISDYAVHMTPDL
jgi:hypothetical protein